MKRVIIACITFYQMVFRDAIGNVLGIKHWCRYHPTCSEYAKQSIEKYGTIKGSYLSIKRLFSCHPFAHTTYEHT